jgi:hypothetical protein
MRIGLEPLPVGITAGRKVMSTAHAIMLFAMAASDAEMTGRVVYVTTHDLHKMYDKISPHTTRTVLEHCWAPCPEVKLVEWLSRHRIIRPKLGRTIGPESRARSGNTQGRVISISVPSAIAAACIEFLQGKKFGIKI